MQTIYFFVLALLGLVTNFLLNLQVYKKATQDVPNHDVLWNYFEINLFYSLASVIITIVLSLLLNMDGGDYLISILTGGNVTADKPFGFYLTAYLIGFVVDYIASILRKIINPLKVNLNPNQQNEN